MQIFVPAYSYPTPPAPYWTRVDAAAPTVEELARVPVALERTYPPGGS